MTADYSTLLLQATMFSEMPALMTWRSLGRPGLGDWGDLSAWFLPPPPFLGLAWETSPSFANYEFGNALFK